MSETSLTLDQRKKITDDEYAKYKTNFPEVKNSLKDRLYTHKSVSKQMTMAFHDASFIP